jgi:polygalacturonase
MKKESMNAVSCYCFVLVSSLALAAASCGDGGGSGRDADADAGNDASDDAPIDGPVDMDLDPDATDDSSDADAADAADDPTTDEVEPCLVIVTNFGADGSDEVDDTEAIQAAIDSIESGVVCIPDGVYMIDAETHVMLNSNITLQLSSGATLKAIPNSAENYAIIMAYEATNIGITGGSIVGERDEHTGDSGEWGMGIDIAGSTGVRIADVNVSECWGDGIYIGSTDGQNYCEDVVIENFTVNHNRRNGISIISARNLTLRSGSVSNTQGTPPQSGIDLEPNDAAEFMMNVLIENVTTADNGTAGFDFGGWGLDVWFGAGTSDPYTVPTGNVSIDIVNFSDTGSYRGEITTNVADYIDYGYDISIL